MFYIIWIVTAFIAVGVGVFVASKVDQQENKKK